MVVLVASCQQVACPSVAGKECDPRNYNCPPTYTCSLAEVCTKPCETTEECWVPVTDGCRFDGYLPGQLQPDGGPFMEVTEDGFCPETKAVVCERGFCQHVRYLDGGRDYDLYGPSDYKGNRSQGPGEQ